MKASSDSLRAMLDKAQAKLAAAQRELQAGWPGEAASRAYYAVFHAIAAVLATRGLSFSSHAQAIGAFNRAFVKSGLFPSDATKAIHRLFEDRQIADYDWVTSVDAETGARDVSDAERLVDACRDYIENHIET